MSRPRNLSVYAGVMHRQKLKIMQLVTLCGAVFVVGKFVCAVHVPWCAGEDYTL